MAKNSKKLASEILEANPLENQVFIFKDGTAFFLKEKADAYKVKHKLEEPEAFFRSGFTPESDTMDTTAFENTIRQQKAQIETLEAATLESNGKVATLEGEVKSLHGNIAVKQKQIDTLTGEKDDLSKALKEQQDKNGDLEAELAAFKAAATATATPEQPEASNDKKQNANGQSKNS